MIQFILLVACTVAAAEPAPASAPGPGSSSVRVTEAMVQRTVRYPEGQVAKAEMYQYLQLSLTWKPDPALKPTGRVRLECGPAVTDAGEDVSAVQSDAEHLVPMPMSVRSRRMGRGQMSLAATAQSLRLAYPLRPATSLDVAGAVLVMCEARPGESVDIAIGESAQVGGGTVSVSAGQRPGQYQVVWPMAIEERIGDVQFIDAVGSTVTNNGYNGIIDKQVSTRTYNLVNGVPAAKLRVVQTGDEVEVRIPFSFKQLPLVAPSAAERRQNVAPEPATPRPGGF